MTNFCRDSARSVVLAAVAELGISPTVLTTTATAREAEQLQHDLVPFLGVDAVELLPAWEPLPFRAASRRRPRPWAASTMWRLRHSQAEVGAPAGLRPAAHDQSSPRSVPFCKGLARGSKTRQAGGDPPGRLGAATSRTWSAYVHAGYRREYQVEDASTVPVGIVDMLGSTASLPTRIDLFGDKVERLTAFEVGAALGYRSRAGQARLPRGRAHRRRAWHAGTCRWRRPSPRTTSRGSRTGSSSMAWSRGCRGSARPSASSPTFSTNYRVVLVDHGAYVTGPPSCWTRRWRSARAWRRPGGLTPTT